MRRSGAAPGPRGAMGCVLVIPAIAGGAVSGAIVGSAYGALVTSDGSRGGNATLFVAAAVLGAFVWSAHRLRKGNIWSEGPDMMQGPDLNWKVQTCGTGTALMYCGLFGSMVQRHGGSFTICTAVLVANCALDCMNIDGIMNTGRKYNPLAPTLVMRGADGKMHYFRYENGERVETDTEGRALAAPPPTPTPM